MLGSADGRADYKKVEEVLQPTEYPDDWPKLPKMELLKKQAEKIGCGEKFRKVRQTTRFHNGPNSCGVEMSASALTGQDTTGLNDGSKTTTLVTYLADAWNWGARGALLYMGTAIISIVWCYFRLPELKHRSYAELDVLFTDKVPARRFAQTQVDCEWQFSRETIFLLLTVCRHSVR